MISRGVLEWLERIFPNSVPDIKDTDREIGARIGEQRVLRKLRHEYNTQNALEKK